jgi:superfamily II DNA or RNA helicase
MLRTDSLRVGEFTLHQHQADGIDDLRDALRRGATRVVLQGPCGVGKTIIATALAHLARKKNKTVLVLTDSRQLVYQMADKLERCDIPHAILMAGEEYSHSAVTVATKQTLFSRCFQKKSVPLPQADMVIVDEAHKSLSNDWLVILKNYRQSVQVGLTATPEDIGHWWDEIVVAGSYAELIPEFLVPARVWIPWEVDMRGVSTSNGDYAAGEAEQRHNRPTLMGDVFSNWKRIAGDRKTVVFASGVTHSIRLCEVFNSNGISAAHVDASTPQECTRSQVGRAKIFDQLRAGEIQVICNVGVCRVGWDAPWVEAGVLAFSTKSLVQYVQTTGRLFRTHDDKVDSILIDHGGNVARHGWPTDDHVYELRAVDPIERREAEAREAAEPRESHCPTCSYVWLTGRRGECPMCGHLESRPGWPRLVVDANLREIKRQPKIHRSEVQKMWDQCLGISANVDYGSAKMAHAIFQKKMGRSVPPDIHNFLSYHASRQEEDFIFRKYSRGKTRWS